MNVAIYFAVLFNCAFLVTCDPNVFIAATGKGNSFDFDSYEDILKHERYQRHVEAVTESVIEHILKQLKKKYPDINKEMPKKQLSHVAENIRKMLKKLKQKKKNRKRRHKNNDWKFSYFKNDTKDT